MDPVKTSIGEIFEPRRQHVIPFFQRHYVWGKNGQWRPLWNDIKTRADTQSGALHFTGAIVVQQKRTQPNQLPAYEIIDGQQRLTTFQLVLCAIRDVCAGIAAEGFAEIAEDAKTYILNTGRQAGGDGQFKLLPKKHDYDAFKAIVLGDNMPPKSGDNLVAAYKYFKAEIAKFVSRDAVKAGALLDAIIRNFGLVSILVNDDDKPEVIFESLNARAKPLLQFDLLRNNLFLRARQGADEDRDSLYSRYWERFDSGGWIQTAAKEQPTELFLQHFLIAKLGVNKVTPLFENYCRYRENARLGTVTAELKELDKYAECYQSVAGMTGDVRACLPQTLADRLRAFNDIVVTPLRPLVLYLMAESGLSPKQLEHVLWACESYVVRSILCKQYRAHFNVFFARTIYYLLGKDMDLPLADSGASAVLRHLNMSSGHTDKWPDDADENLKSAFYGGEGWSARNPNDTRDVRYILRRIELRLRDNPRTEDVSTGGQLQLEHVLPRNWRRHWTLPASGGQMKYADILSADYKRAHPEWNKICPAEGEESDALADQSYASALQVARERDALMHSLGNLTLLTKALNPELSDKQFSVKREALRVHSVLLLNQRIVQREQWDVHQIKERTCELRNIFRQLWPDAQWFLDNIPPE
ncbi:MAG: DUF262 domain-containing protein [Gammaproteobacteria bacterium]